jgi:hypothetical protein
MHRLSFFIFVFLLLGYSCQKEADQKIAVEKYPNQDAPLAILMREMFVDLEKIKEAVENGKNIDQYVEQHKYLLDAKPTNPDVKTETFQLMGEEYLKNLSKLESSQKEVLELNYKAVISSCLACHQQYCPGPVKRINLLQSE